MAKKGLNGRAYRELRAWMKANLAWTCHVCQRPISRAITEQDPMHKLAWSADHHPIRRADGGPTVLSNMKPAHNICNSARGSDAAPPAYTPVTSMEW